LGPGGGGGWMVRFVVQEFLLFLSVYCVYRVLPCRKL